MRIFISTGEPSGDLHAANLVLSLKKRLPDAEFVGFGGPRMKAAGATLLYPLVDLAVMWFGRVLLNLHKFIKLLNDADRYFETNRPDVAVLIDYPGFHWLLARRAKRRGIPVVYFVPPQLWAWAGWRVKKVAQIYRPSALQLAFRTGLVPRTRSLERGVCRPSLFRRTGRTSDRRGVRGVGAEKRRSALGDLARLALSRSHAQCSFDAFGGAEVGETPAGRPIRIRLPPRIASKSCESNDLRT